MRVLLFLLPVLFSAFSAGLSAAPPATALDPGVAKILDASAQFYAGLNSFEVDLISTTSMKSDMMNNEMGSSFHLAAQRPASFSLVIKGGMLGGTFVTDGKIEVTYMPIFNKYTSTDAPAQLSGLVGPGSEMTFALVEGGLPLGFKFLLGEKLPSTVKTNEDLGMDKVGDQPAHHLRLTEPSLITEIWIADGPKPLLLQYKVTPDMSNVMKHVPADKAKDLPFNLSDMKMSRTTTYSNWQVDQPVAAAAFQFQPPLGAQLVDEFVKQPPSPLVGKMAPDFQLNDLGGQPVSLASLRGRVVVLDFWATWCGPCVASLPLVSATAADFKAQGVVFYAANVRETANKVRSFQTQKSLTFPVLLDADGKVSDLYQAKAIPETVIIDKTGKIQAVHVGYNPAIKKKLSTELTQVLAGQDLAVPSSSAASMPTEMPAPAPPATETPTPAAPPALSAPASPPAAGPD